MLLKTRYWTFISQLRFSVPPGVNASRLDNRKSQRVFVGIQKLEGSMPGPAHTFSLMEKTLRNQAETRERLSSPASVRRDGRKERQTPCFQSSSQIAAKPLDLPLLAEVAL